jgi:acetamidase/formamidase
MARHRFDPTAYHNILGTLAPVLRIGDGDSVVTTTLDAHGRDAANLERAPAPNPMTGPFFVEGAERGDALLVSIDRMTPTRNSGWTFSTLAPNVVDAAAVRGLPERRTTDWVIDRTALTARLAKPLPGVEDLILPLAPMIGCFGVAPPMGQALSTATSAQNGGNMDYRRFAPGTIAAFPVFAPGALFFLGDGHACQGDGEIVGTGIETTFEVEFTVRVRKGAKFGWPRAEMADDIVTLGNARPLDQALQHATTEMFHWLGADFGLGPEAASHLMGQVVRYDIGNVFDPAFTVACRIAKRWLNKPPHGWLGWEKSPVSP